MGGGRGWLTNAVGEYMSVSDAEFRGVVFDALKGLDALSTFIETRFEIADNMEENGMEEAAAEVREVWAKIWGVVTGAPRRALLAELHDFMDPVTYDDIDLEDGLAEDTVEVSPDDTDGHEGYWLTQNA